MRILLFILFLTFSFQGFTQQIPIGDWNYHLSFTSSYYMTQNQNNIFVATNSSVFTIDKETQEINDFDKNNALSDVGVTHIKYNPESNYLFVGYLNGNIDLIRDGVTVNLNDIKRSTNIIGAKRINDVVFSENLLYISTGFGIVIVNLEKLEIKESIFTGPNSTESPTYQTLLLNDTLYAATENGVYFIDADNSFISNFDFWTKIENFPDNESNGPFTQVVEYKGHIFVNYRNNANQSNDVIYRKDGDFWTPILNIKKVNSVKSTLYGLLVCTNTPTFLLDENGGKIRSLWTFNGNYFQPLEAEISEDSIIWIANSKFSVVVDDAIEPFNIVPNGPFKDIVWQMNLFFGELWIAGGAVTEVWNKTWNFSGAYYFTNNQWSNFNLKNTPLFGNFGFNDIITVAVNQNNPQQVFLGSYGSGLIEMVNGETKRGWNVENIDETSLSIGDFGDDDDFVGIGGLTFDRNNNLWITNPLNLNPVSVLTENGSWQSFSFGNALGGNLKLGEIMASFTSNQKWIIHVREGILVFDDGGTPLDINDDQYKTLTTGAGNGNLPVLDVISMVEDLDGEIWVGTAEGPVVFYSPGNIFSNNNYDASRILIEQDGNVQILLETEVITALAIDGGNRKWIGTQNSGVFLLSSDGVNEIHHFTTKNSPLLSNEIKDIVLDHLTGEVYISTSIGLVSYRSDATAPPAEVDKLKIYPNPVRYDYFGPIAIDGVASNSSVKITDEAGNTVNLLISEGGQAIWDGTDFNGERVATGVYFVLAVDKTGKKSASGKILVLK
jgi:hypothetical protein